MTLDDVLSVRRPIARPSLPDLAPLATARKRVMDRWPDVIAKPPERDHERLLAQFKSILETNQWDAVKLTTVLRVAHIAFDANHRDRADLQAVLQFFFDELAATRHTTFINGMMSVYVSSFEPGGRHSAILAESLFGKREELNARWNRALHALPFILDARKAHHALADRLLAEEAPYDYLTELGFPNPLSGGLIHHAHLRYVESLKPQLHSHSVIDRLFRWVMPKPGAVRTSGSAVVIDAVLSPWKVSQPSDEIRQCILDALLAAYNDPRTNRGHWAGVSDEIMNIIFRWLTREDMRFFTGVVDATQNNHMWPPRRDFWLQLYDEKLIEQAWVAFCSSAERYARLHLMKSEGGSQRRFGRQVAGGTRSDTSLLIMKIGNKIVVDGCHNYKTHIFDEKDLAAPRLFEWDYDCGQIMRRSLTSKAHNSIPHWKEWVRTTLNVKVEILEKRAAPATASVTPAPSARKAPDSQRKENFHPSNHRMEAMRDLGRLRNQLHQLGELTPDLQSIFVRLERRQVLNSEELAVMRPITSRLVTRYDLSKLDGFLQPIFHHALPPEEMALWIRKAQRIAELANLKGLLSPKSREALNRLAENKSELRQSDRNAIEYLAQQFRAQGMELADFVRKDG
jgi:hypothetical protein